MMIQTFYTMSNLISVICISLMLALFYVLEVFSYCSPCLGLSCMQMKERGGVPSLPWPFIYAVDKEGRCALPVLDLLMKQREVVPLRHLINANERVGRCAVPA